MVLLDVSNLLSMDSLSSLRSTLTSLVEYFSVLVAIKAQLGQLLLMPNG